jgi:hypothetical protein
MAWHEIWRSDDGQTLLETEGNDVFKLRDVDTLVDGDDVREYNVSFWILEDLQSMTAAAAAASTTSPAEPAEPEWTLPADEIHSHPHAEHS